MDTSSAPNTDHKKLCSTASTGGIRTALIQYPRLLSEGTSNNSTVAVHGKGIILSSTVPNASITALSQCSVTWRTLYSACSCQHPHESNDSSLHLDVWEKQGQCMKNKPLFLSNLVSPLLEKKGRRKYTSRTRSSFNPSLLKPHPFLKE